ncbi:MAG: DJ-1/PfpI family protein [Coriobacteriales bacterium]
MARPVINSNVVFVIAPEVFRDEEYAYPREELVSAGANVLTASSRPGSCIGKLGMKAEAGLSVRSAANMRWDAVVFVGGQGASCYFEDADAHALARKVYDAGGVVAAICIAPTILGKAGLLEGVAVTSFPSEKETLEALGARWTGNTVEVSHAENAYIVTANGPDAAREFGKTLVQTLA